MAPLTGIRVLEFSGIGPVPYAAMVLADYGASVIRVDRDGPAGVTGDITSRGKTSVVVGAKDKAGHSILTKLIKSSDVLLDPYRPGVLEKLGFGPAECEKLNPKLIYARMTGFPRANSSYKDMAGHDLNYIAVSGVLDMIRSSCGKPVPPLNLLGDFAGGGAMLVQGILLALLERGTSGKGQTVHTDMVGGTRYISSFPLLLKHPSNAASKEMWGRPAGNNLLDGGSPFYAIYPTADDDKFMTVACLEPQFFAEFARILNPFLPDGQKLEPKRQQDRAIWPAMRETLAAAFKTKKRDDWAKLFHGTDACCVPVLAPHEVTADEVGAAPTGEKWLAPTPHPHLGRTPAGKVPAYDNTGDFYVQKGTGLSVVLKELGGKLDAGEVAYLKKVNGEAGAKL